MTKVDSELTPMMHQYLKIKKEHPDAILFFRLGDFYEMFFEDAKIASPILGVTLTSRGSGKNNRVPMCGIPYHASENYINRLINASLKVAICEQVEDPKVSRGIVKREITRVITPATLVGQNMLLKPYNNYLVSVYQYSPEEYGLAIVDLLTGEFKITELNSQEKMFSELARLSPSELLLSDGIKTDKELLARIKQKVNSVITQVEAWTFGLAQGYEKLLAHFKVKNLQGFGAQDMSWAICAAGAALRYLENTQKTEILHINKIVPYFLNKFMVLDSVAQRNLELVRTMRGEKKNSLLNELNFTSTPMGKRLITQWIQQPLLDKTEINCRLDAVEVFYNNQKLRNEYLDKLSKIVDIERLIGRISLGVANARDVFSLKESLKIIPEIKKELKNLKGSFLEKICQQMNECSELVYLLEKSIREDSPLSVKEGRMINPGFNAELDELLRITQGGKEWLATLQKKEIERTGISSLKIRYNRIFGYYIEITKTNLHLVPEDYMRKQTLVNAERFITPELKEQEEKIVFAQEKIINLEFDLFKNICQEILKNINILQNNARAIATVDVINSLAIAAIRNNYTRPEIAEDTVISIKEGRHPVLENLMDTEKFIPNDTYLDQSQNQVLIITGPNMAGKSTYIRQVALIVLMSQMGSFVPAKEAKIGIVDRIFTRVGAADDITAGMSTFMLEMSETANILNNATSRSMIILDEIGRGTSTFDGLSIAWATAEYLHKDNGIKPKTLFATHYHELAEMELLFEGIKNYNVAVREWNDQVVFLYKLIKGFADHSYGIHVARLAGLPKEVVQRAREILSNLEINSITGDGIPSLVKSDVLKNSKKEIQPELFNKKENPVVKEILLADINKISPLEALNLINKWKEALNNK
ncbi:MAG: DNA mismatch repair protein MutS [Candidatus Omnitrophota bacterium]